MVKDPRIVENMIADKLVQLAGEIRNLTAQAAVGIRNAHHREDCYRGAPNHSFKSGWGDNDPHMGVIRDRTAQDQAEAMETLLHADASKALQLFRDVEAWLRVARADLDTRAHFPKLLNPATYDFLDMRLKELEDILRNAAAAEALDTGLVDDGNVA